MKNKSKRILRTLSLLGVILLFVCGIFVLSVLYIYTDFKNFRTEVVIPQSQSQKMPINKAHEAHLFLDHAFEKHPLYGKCIQKLLSYGNWWRWFLGKGPTRGALKIIGYTDQFVYQLDESIKIFYAGDVLLKSGKIKIISVYDSLEHKLLKTFETALPVERQYCRAYHGSGCAYKGQYEILAKNIGVGSFYFILEDAHHGRSLPIYFDIIDHEVDVDITLMHGDHTWQAYNNEGGSSLYRRYNTQKRGYISLKDEQVTVSMMRPLNYHVKKPIEYLYHSPLAVQIAIKEIKEMGLRYRVISNTYLDKHPEILDKTKLLMMVAHNEYWTTRMFEAVGQFVKRGGRILNLSGNVAWWYIHKMPDSFYLDRIGPQESAINTPYHMTGSAHQKGIEHLPADIFGTSFAYAGYPMHRFTSKETLKAMDSSISNGSRGIQINMPNHPVFKDLDLKKGQWFIPEGTKDLIFCEIDGVPLDEHNQILTGYGHPTMKILGSTYIFCDDYMPNHNHCHKNKPTKIAIFIELEPFEGGGKVISFGSLGFVYGLYDRNQVIVSIFRHALDYLLAET